MERESAQLFANRGVNGLFPQLSHVTVELGEFLENCLISRVGSRTVYF